MMRMRKMIEVTVEITTQGGSEIYVLPNRLAVANRYLAEEELALGGTGRKAGRMVLMK
jgi:hypothetical protein